MRTVCLLGNGVSIAYNADLCVGQLTADLLARFGDLGASDPELALSSYAADLASTPGDHFEALLGPLASTSRALANMTSLAGLTDAAPIDVTAAIETTADFLRGVYRTGTAITLGHIAERTIGGSYWDGPWPVASRLIALGDANDLTVGTLSYDGLLHSGLMDAGTDMWQQTIFPISDLADGRTESTVEVEVVPHHRIVGHTLRKSADMPAERATLLQLHGSLGWLQHPNFPGGAAKFDLPDLRRVDYWTEWQAGNTLWEPVVVLTDRKDTAVEGWPYSLAYSTFFSRLLSADRWLIAGYGLGDEPVNAMFSAAVRERRRLGDTATPPTLVVGLGESTQSLGLRAAGRLGLDPPAVTANVDGMPGVFDSESWSEWATLDN